MFVTQICKPTHTYPHLHTDVGIHSQSVPTYFNMYIYICINMSLDTWTEKQMLSIYMDRGVVIVNCYIISLTGLWLCFLCSKQAFHICCGMIRHCFSSTHTCALMLFTVLPAVPLPLSRQEQVMSRSLTAAPESMLEIEPPAHHTPSEPESVQTRPLANHSAHHILRSLVCSVTTSAAPVPRPVALC